MQIGVIGYGAIGRSLVEHIEAAPDLELSFVLTRTSITDASLAARLRVSQMSDALLDRTDLVIEAAHPQIVTMLGEQILRHADLFVVSAGALVDDNLRESLIATAQTHGRSVIVPYGALAGLDELAGRKSGWRTATITFVKPPSAFEPAPADVAQRSVLYDGPVRGIVARYPRNVNAMVTFALATTGLDNARAVLISEPSQEFATLDYEVIGNDGGKLRVTKNQPMLGVSGSEMPDAIIHSLRTFVGGESGLHFG